MNDTTLGELLSVAASSYEVPPFSGVLEAAGETAVPVRRRLDHPRFVAAGVLLVGAVGGAALWSGHGSGTLTPAAGAVTAGSPAGMRTASNSPANVSGKGHLAAAPGTTDASTGGGPQPFSSGTGLATTALGAVHGQTAPDSVLSGAPGVADGAKVIHTGTLTLTVAQGQVTAVLTAVTGLATGVGGYVSSSTTAESGSAPSGTVVLRVPASAYDTVLTQARTLGTVVATTSSGKDVTTKAADQQARLTALKASRDQFLTILAKAKTIGETLAVQQRVDGAQTQIDQLQGEINVLTNQASYGTLTVSVAQKSPAAVVAEPVHRESGLHKAWKAAVTGFVTGVEALLSRSGRGLVVLLVLLGVAAVLRGAWKVSRRRLV